MVIALMTKIIDFCNGEVLEPDEDVVASSIISGGNLAQQQYNCDDSP